MGTPLFTFFLRSIVLFKAILQISGSKKWSNGAWQTHARRHGQTHIKILRPPAQKPFGQLDYTCSAGQRWPEELLCSLKSLSQIDWIPFWPCFGKLLLPLKQYCRSVVQIGSNLLRCHKMNLFFGHPSCNIALKEAKLDQNRVQQWCARTDARTDGRTHITILRLPTQKPFGQ